MYGKESMETEVPDYSLTKGKNTESLFIEVQHLVEDKTETNTLFDIDGTHRDIEIPFD
jgi:hypothetical protein